MDSKRNIKVDAQNKKRIRESFSKEHNLSPSEKMRERVRKQLGQVTNRDKTLKENNKSWIREDLNRYEHTWEAEGQANIDISVARTFMDEEDIEYEREKLQKGKISLEELSHAEAIFGRVPRQDLAFFELHSEETIENKKSEPLISFDSRVSMSLGTGKRIGNRIDSAINTSTSAFSPASATTDNVKKSEITTTEANDTTSNSNLPSNNTDCNSSSENASTIAKEWRRRLQATKKK